ncbi:MAG: YdiY family protein [Opitutales bacterium]
MLSRALPLLIAVNLASGAVVELTNGDRISGELRRLDADRVLIVSPVFGEAVVNVAQVANPEVLPAIPVQTAPEMGSDASANLPAEDGVSISADAAADTTTTAAPAAEATAEDKPWYSIFSYKSPEKWDGEFAFGASRETGNTEETDIDVAVKISWEKSDKDSFLWKADYDYGRENQERTTDEWHVSMQYRRSLSERWFLQSLTSNDTDDIQEIRWNIRQNLGLGYHAVKRERLTIDVIPGLGVEYIDQPGEDGFFLNVSFLENLTWIIVPDRLTLEQFFEFYIDPTDTDIWELEFDVSLTTDLTEQWALRLGFNYERDNSVGAGVDEEDTETTASIIWKF